MQRCKKIIANPKEILTDEEYDNLKQEIFPLYLQSLSSYMESQFDKHERSTYICSYKFEIAKNIRKIIDIKLYSVIIVDKLDKKEYDAIYGKYTINDDPMKSYSIVLNIIPKDNKINSIGLYDKYVDFGIYVCKPYEYLGLVETLVRGLNPKVNMKNSEYVFLGEMYNNLFPAEIKY